MSISKYVLNFDELSEQLIPKIKEVETEIKRNPPEMSVKTKQKLKLINNKIPINPNIDDLYDNIKYLLNFVSRIQELKGDFCIDGMYKNIPAIKEDYYILFQYDYDIYINALEFSQSGWKKDDRWSLIIGDKVIFDKVTIKEIGDKKCFHTLKYVPKGMAIKVILHNISGNSRQVWVDLEYIKSNLIKEEIHIQCVDNYDNILKDEYIQTNIPSMVIAPKIKDYDLISIGQQIITQNTIQPIIFKYSHDYNIKITANWEENSKADIDCYAIILNTNKTISFSNKREEGLWLDKDVRNHIDNQDEEVITCLLKTGILMYSIRNYNGEKLNKPIVISVYNKSDNEEKLLKTIKYDLSNDKNKYDIFKINLKNNKIEVLI